MSAIPNISAAAQAFGNLASSAASGATGASSAVNGASSAAGTSGVSGGVLGSQSPSYDTPFAGVLRDAISKTQQLDTQASNTVTGLLSGQGVDIHTAMIATEKSDLAFEMMLALRNKAIGAYQQLMGMQF
jgi:flagellar hook-basal body complex protein FliE